MKFWFDDPNKRKSYALSTLGTRCKYLKRRLWKEHRRNTIDESFKERPPLIPEDQWRHFVHFQFTEKAKKTRERNARNRRLLKIPHSLGKNSLARKSDEIEEETGRKPTRGELFIASRKNQMVVLFPMKQTSLWKKLRKLRNILKHQMVMQFPKFLVLNIQEESDA